MGKFGIGARVRDDGGDEGVIVEKRKGQRLVNYDFEPFGKIWNQKASLTALPCPETSENAYSDGAPKWISGQFVNTTDGDTAVVESGVDDADHVWVRHASGQRTRLPASWLTAWVPKVGERVRVVDAGGGGATGDECTVTRVNPPDEDDGDIYCYLTDLTGGAEGLYSYRLEPVVAPATADAWVPAIGDCVRFVEHYTARARIGDEGVIQEFWEADGNPKGGVVVKMDNGADPHCYTSRVELVPPLTIEAGKFYRTRDGRKVGPMGKSGEDLWPFKSQAIGGAYYNADGTCPYFPDSDLVAEWVEPAVVAVAEATATELTIVDGGVYRSRDGEVWSDPQPIADDDEGYTWTLKDSVGCRYRFFDKGRFFDTRESGCDLVEVIITPEATPPAKFKVGDRVVVNTGRWYGFHKGSLATVTAVLDNHQPVAFNAAVDAGGDDFGWFFDADDLSPAPAGPTLPIHSTVTFTATGRLSAINDNGHMQVTFPGLPAGRNSFALPAEYVALAN